MAWDTDLVVMTRMLVNDFNEPQKHTDDYIRRALVCAAVSGVPYLMEGVTPLPVLDKAVPWTVVGHRMRLAADA